MTWSGNISSSQLRELFVKFFMEKGHQLVSHSSLVPADPSVLFTTAGMQQFKSHYLSPKEAPSRRVVTVQPSFRTTDIEEVGDKTHLTLFEMLGNFSFGYEGGDKNRLEESQAEADSNEPYFKKDAIVWAWEFLTGQDWLAIPYERVSASFFRGDETLPKDQSSRDILEFIGGCDRITPAGKEENFWGPTGLEGPCGPTVEFYVDGVEIWNLVFNEYYFKDNKYTKLDYWGVDTGAGLERLLVVLNGYEDVYNTDVLKPLIDLAAREGVSQRSHQRILADHAKAAVFALADGVVPSNKEAGYVVRQLLRRAMVAAGKGNEQLLKPVAKEVQSIYQKPYPHLGRVDLGVFDQEIVKWQSVEAVGEKYLNKYIERGIKKISGKEAFDIFQSHGFPVELLSEMAKKRKIEVDQRGFWLELEKHHKVSRVGAHKKFKGGLSSRSAIETRYHTATHLLHRALLDVLGEHSFQRGSNITAERLRFDFAHPHAATPAELAQIEEIVNQKISAGLPVTHKHMTPAEATSAGALGLFNERYGQEVIVYAIGQWSKEHTPYSLEICGGPHVDNTAQIGKLKIVKEEAVSAGVRRIRAVIGK